MDNSGSRRFITVFWRKPLYGKLKIISYFFTIVCLGLILVVPTYVSYTFYKNHSADKELQHILDSGAEFDQLSREVKQELDEYNQLQSELESIDPGNPEYAKLKESSNALRRNIAARTPNLVKSYDEEGLPVLMTYKEFIGTTIK
ncbi:MAG: hypothetical protein JXA49_02500 [Actinobacteria bacterium]|nr:hypothetical protein [Actinomycetota bacterium]